MQVNNAVSLLEENFQQVLYTDELTGGRNRRYFLKHFPNEASQAKANHTPYSVAAIDVDYFKSINDTYGHHQGDHMLVQLSAIMKHALPSGVTPVRYGGDEFIMLLPNIERDAAVGILNDFASVVRAHTFDLEGDSRTLKVTMSIGVAGFPHDTEEPESLYELADKAAYISKKLGRDRVSTLNDAAAQQLDLEDLHKLFPCPRLVGRVDIMRDARRLVQPQAGVNREILVLEGKSGHGKSRLLDEVRAAADPQRSVVVKCVGLPYLVGQPFGMLVDAISSQIRTDPRLALQLTSGLDSQQIGEVARFLPDLFRMNLSQSTSAPLTGDERKRTLIKAFVQMLLSWAAGRNLVLLFDDFQWVDPGTLEVITALKENPQGKSAAISLAVRPRKEFQDENRYLAEFFEVQKHRGSIVFRHLGPMDDPEIEEMVGAVLPGLEAPRDFYLAVIRKSHGIPLLVEEILKHLIQTNRIKLDPATRKVVVTPVQEQDVPSNIRDVLQLRVNRMDEDIRGMMAKAAVLGEAFTLDRITAMEGKNQGHVLSLLDQARKMHLVEPDAANPDLMRFTSQGVRDAVYDSVDREERAQLHEKAAQVVEQQVAGATTDSALGELSYHYEKAGSIERALQYAEQIVKQYGKIIPDIASSVLLSRTAATREWPQETPLSPEAQEMAIQLARYLRASIQNFRMYPAHSEVIQESESKVHNSVLDILQVAEALTFSDANGVFLINGQNVESAIGVKGALGELTSILASSGLKGVAFKRGVTLEEIKAFLELLCMREADVKQQGGWPALVRERGLKNIVVNELVYLQVGERDIVVAKKAQPGTMIIKEVNARPGETHSADLMSAGEAMLQAGQGSGAQAGGQMAPSDAYVKALQQQLEKITKILEALPQHIVAGASGVEQPRNPSQNPMKGGGGTAPAPAPQAVQELQKVMKLQQDLATNMSLVLKGGVPPDLVPIFEDAEVLCEHLESPDPIKVAGASQALLQKKKAATDPLLSLVVRTGDARARKVSVKHHETKEGENQLVERLIQMLYKTEYREERIHILQALGEFDNARVKGAVAAYIHYSDKDTRRAALRILEKTDATAYCQELMRALRDPHNWVRADAAAALGHMKHVEAVPELLKLIRPRSFFFHEDDAHVQKQACRALGFIRDARAIPHLVKVLRRRPLMFFIHPKDMQVRAAAAMALAEFSDPAAEKALREACKDGMVAVRAAAKLAYSRLKGTTMDFS